MPTYAVKARTGERIRLYSDDTFTLAFSATKDNPATEETTAQVLADSVALKSLMGLWQKEPSGKLSQAIQIAVARDYAT